MNESLGRITADGVGVSSEKRYRISCIRCNFLFNDVVQVQIGVNRNTVVYRATGKSANRHDCLIRHDERKKQAANIIDSLYSLAVLPLSSRSSTWFRYETRRNRALTLCVWLIERSVALLNFLINRPSLIPRRVIHTRVIDSR